MASSHLPVPSRIREYSLLSLLLIVVGYGGYLLPATALNFLATLLSASLIFVYSKKDQVKETRRSTRGAGVFESRKQINGEQGEQIGDHDSGAGWPGKIPAKPDNGETLAEISDQAGARSLDISFVSDDENLIEIALPGGHSLGSTFTIRQNPQPFLPDLPAELVVRRRDNLLLELWTEIVDEDNLIEIDIVAGSVKPARPGSIKP